VWVKSRLTRATTAFVANSHFVPVSRPWLPELTARARSKFGAPMFKTEVLQKHMICIEESTCDNVGTFRRPIVSRRLGNRTPLPPWYTPGLF